MRLKLSSPIDTNVVCTVARSSFGKGWLAVAALIVASGIWSCSEIPGPSQPGTIQVSVQATGGDIDDGYEVIVGDRHGLIGANAGGSFVVSPGPVVVELTRVDANCTVAGENPRTVEVESLKTLRVVFAVTCVATGVQINARTTGADAPPQYVVKVDDLTPHAVVPNGSVIVSRLLPGTHVVSMTLPRPNCSVVGENPRTATVQNGAVTAVTFDIACVAVARPEKIAYTIDSVGLFNVVIRRLATANPDGSGEMRIESGHSPSWAPDGKSIVYSNLLCDADYYYYCTGSLLTIDPEIGTLTGIGGGFFANTPAWAPTGDLIAFTSANREAVYLSQPNGIGRSQFFVAQISKARDPAWSPDGQRLVLACSVGGPTFNICTVRRDGTGYVELTSEPGSEVEPAWSPDGTRIAFTMIAAGAQLREIFLVPLGGGNLTRLTDGFDPAWSPDGTKLVFARDDGLFTINADGTNVKRLTTGLHREPAWRP